MEVISIHPYGYCSGVNGAILLSLAAKRSNPTRNVYLLGKLVHNQDAIKDLTDAGLILLDESKKPLKEYIKSLQRGDVIVFSAHGHPKEWEELAKEKGLIIVDATCPFVKDNEESAQNEKNIIYIGLSGHLEAEAFLANVPQAVLYDVKSETCDFSKIQVDDPLVISQTTLGPNEIEKAIATIEEKFPAYRKGKQRCATTVSRQTNLLENYQKTDATIVIGSTLSNNSKKLLEIASNENRPAYMVLNLDELKMLDLSGVHSVCLASGASTSSKTFKECRDYLESL